ncbi:MAG: UDP-N-acetylglucosamine 2-epimerase (non-hydrolyzing) [Candidatus Hydrothermarchaeaceae archaeon]
MKPLIVASTRPELIKLAPVMCELDKKGIEYKFVTTGQHYDLQLFGAFIRDLKLKEPDYDIEIGSGTQAYQTALGMTELEKIFVKERPDVVIVEGDTNSVLSASLAAVKLHIPVAHVEAGLRSFDRNMPEEINRTVADHCSEALFAPTEGAALNLVNEGIPPRKIFITGNTIVDATLQNIKLANDSILQKFPEDFLLLTLHRAENVDSPDTLKGIMKAITGLGRNVVFPVHPRTEKMLEGTGISEHKNISLTEPLGYLDFLPLLKNARAVLTDSGGIQEEAIVLNTPCITLRTTTERPETVEAGGNILAGVSAERITETVKRVLDDKELYENMKHAENPLGDGRSAGRIVNILIDLHEKGALKITSPDFTGGMPEKRYIEVDSALEGKRVGELEFAVLNIIEDGKEKFPHKDVELKKGQLLVTLNYRL